jgi:hypothetical protein
MPDANYNLPRGAPYYLPGHRLIEIMTDFVLSDAEQYRRLFDSSDIHPVEYFVLAPMNRNNSLVPNPIPFTSLSLRSVIFAELGEPERKSVHSLYTVMLEQEAVAFAYVSRPGVLDNAKKKKYLYECST